MTAAVENGFKKQLETGKLPDKHVYFVQKKPPDNLAGQHEKDGFILCLPLFYF